MAQHDMAQVKALTFDVFGTVVDWRGSLIREGLAFGAARGIQIDWSSFADAWRGGYSPSMNRVRTLTRCTAWSSTNYW
jgi:2-haloacid dehalogenase